MDWYYDCLDLLYRRPYGDFGEGTCSCQSPCLPCSGYEVTWFGSCSGGVIKGTGFVKEYVDGKFKMRLSDLTGLVSSEKMILKYGDDSYELHKG